MATLTKRMSTGCAECDTRALTRNNYFTGKFMVERDFTDEQHYFRERHRLHNQRLHGSGVVCGLDLKSHADPDCRHRYVTLQPGSAIDCCGRDILVTHEVTIDLFDYDEIRQLIEAPDDTDHELQFEVCYRECPTEEVPVLYDECGCDDSRCEPNRILESHSINVILDPEPDADDVTAVPELSSGVIPIAHAKAVAVHEAGNRLYVMTEGDISELYQLNLQNHAVETAISLESRGAALGVSPDGMRLYVVQHHKDGIDAGDARLRVFDVSDADTLSTDPGRAGDIPGSQGEQIELSVNDDDRVAVLLQGSGVVAVWEPGIPDISTIDRLATLGVPLSSIVFNSDGGELLSAETGTQRFHRFDLSTPTPGLNHTTVTLSEGHAHRLAMVPTTSGDIPLILDQDANRLAIADGSSGLLSAVLDLAHTPEQALISPGGNWAYVLMQDAGNSWIQATNLRRLMEGKPGLSGGLYPLGADSRSGVLTAGGGHAYVPYVDDPDLPAVGGVQVIDITEGDCESILWSRPDCPDCEEEHYCVVVATVQAYRGGYRLLDAQDPPSDYAEDAEKGIARIDNDLGRDLLPSTRAIAEALACLMDNCCGSLAESPAPMASEVPPHDHPHEHPHEHPETDPGDHEHHPPIEGLDPDLAHICAINWSHEHHCIEAEVFKDGLMILCDRPIRNADVIDNRFAIRVLGRVTGNEKQPFECWCELKTERIVGLLAKTPCSFDGEVEATDNPEKDVDGILIELDNLDRIIEAAMELRIEIRGDFIRGQHLNGDWRALDADHLPPWLPDRKSGNGVEGGVFESWFQVKSQCDKTIGEATEDSLVEIGISPADAKAVIEARNNGPFLSWTDLEDRVDGIGPKRREIIQRHFRIK